MWLAIVPLGDDMVEQEATTMAQAQSAYDRLTREEFARRGDEIYERTVRPRLPADTQGRFVAIDVESGEYQLADDELTAIDRLQARVPGAAVWLRRVGRRDTYHFGLRREE